MNRMQRGFTLVELLVVIAIIGLLIALLLPAVQAAREGARRAECFNNLKQTGVAMHGYHVAKGTFPPGFVSRATVRNGPGLGPGWGWAAHLLPYLEQQNIAIDLKRDVTDPIHDSLRTKTIPLLMCPSDPVRDLTFAVKDEQGAELTTVAFANYVGVGGTFEVTGFPDTGSGVLFRNRTIRVADISDGTSNTLMVGERGSEKSPQTTWVGAVTKASVPPINPAYDTEGPPVLILTNTGQAADRRVPNNALDHVEDTNSQHPQGANFLFCDGSAHLLTSFIDATVWEALGTRAGSEPISEF